MVQVRWLRFAFRMEFYVEPFDAVLLVAFGGPQGPADVRPFLENVLRGRRVAPERIEEVAHHYELFGGVSPLTELTLQQARRSRARLLARGVPLPVHVGMRNWHPFLADTLADDVARAASVARSACSPRRSAATRAARSTGRTSATRAPRCGRRAAATSTSSTSATGTSIRGFIEANADHVRDGARPAAAGSCATRARLVFTAHSIPVSMAERYPYEAQLRASAQR